MKAINKNSKRIANNTRRIARNEKRTLQNSDDILSLWHLEDHTDYHVTNPTQFRDKTGVTKKQLRRGSPDFWVDKRNYYEGIEKSPKQQKIRRLRDKKSQSFSEQNIDDLMRAT